MTYVILFEDNETHADQRTRHMQAHLAFLQRNADCILAAGPLKDADSNEAAGGLWLVTAENTQQVTELVESDPFWPTGLRRSVRVLQWTQVFRDGARQI